MVIFHMQTGTGKPAQIASWGHLTGYLLITAGITAWGFHIQTAGVGNAPTGELIDHSQVIKHYILAILADCALLYYCWVGVHRRGGNLDTLSGGLWKSWPMLARISRLLCHSGCCGKQLLTVCTGCSDRTIVLDRLALSCRKACLKFCFGFWYRSQLAFVKSCKLAGTCNVSFMR